MRSAGFIIIAAISATLAAWLFPLQAATNGFHFKLPADALYTIEQPPPAIPASRPGLQTVQPPQWLLARGPRGGDVELGNRIVVQIRPDRAAATLPLLMAGGKLKLARSFAENTFILEAADA